MPVALLCPFPLSILLQNPDLPLSLRVQIHSFLILQHNCVASLPSTLHVAPPKLRDLRKREHFFRFSQGSLFLFRVHHSSQYYWCLHCFYWFIQYSSIYFNLYDMLANKHSLTDHKSYSNSYKYFSTFGGQK